MIDSPRRPSRWRLRLSTTLGALALFLPAPAAAQASLLDQVGVPFCPGDGCPCGNESAASGCGNDGFDQDPLTGALLFTRGTADIASDDLEVTASGLAPGAAAILFMGSPEASIRSGDGLLCIGAGTTGLYRFPLQTADATGIVSYGAIVAASQTLGMGAGALSPGDTRAFQLFYRDTMGPCGNAFNATNAVGVTFHSAASTLPLEHEMGGRPIAGFPHFERVDAINEGDSLYLTIDGTPLAQATGLSVDLYVVAAKSAAEWALDPTLNDARGAPQAFTVTGGSAASAIALLDTGTLQGTPSPGALGDRAGIPFDLVVDVDRDGLLGTGDIVDGGGDQPALIIARDLAAPGHHPVTSALYNGGSFRRQKVYYPGDIASMGRQPLVIISHGNGHNYQWYNYLGEHLGSHGYVVMSHQNNTMPGIESAALTTLDNTDEFLGNLSSIANGELLGHIDARRIAWIGHSRGAEGVARAYQRLTLQDYVPVHYSASDIRLLSSMAPTVFLGLTFSNPRGVPYHVWTGSADADVTGAATGSSVLRSFVLHERAEGERMVTTLHGAGHAVFHDAGHGGRVATGPCQLTFAEAHEIIEPHLTALLAHYLRDEPGVKDFLWRQYESFSPIGRPQSPCVSVNLEFRDSPLAGNLVIDDVQTNDEVFLSSSGGAITFDVVHLAEDRLRDTNSTMTGGTSDAFNGMSRVKGGQDTSRGITFSWNSPSFLRYEIPMDRRDLRGGRFLSFRATQLTREANTIMRLEDLTFRVSLIDAAGTSSAIGIGAFGGGIEEPYARTGDGVGTGWSNEFETQRIRLSDFTMGGNTLDLSDVTDIQFDFGLPGESPEGSIGFDDLQITAR